MQWPWNVSDADFVRRVDRQYRWRRPVGVVMVAISAMGVGGGMYCFHLMEYRLLPMFTEQGAQFLFQIGVFLGLSGAKLLIMASFFFFFALHLFFAGRRDRLLLTYHRRLVELGELAG